MRPADPSTDELLEPQGGRVLVVDDHPLVRQGLVRYLSLAGFEVVGAAENGAEAFELVEQCRPEVVTTNIRMPVMDGLELTSLIRERFPEVQVVILTAYPDEAFRREARMLGAAGYVVKTDALQGQPEVLIRSIRFAVAIARGQHGKG